MVDFHAILLEGSFFSDPRGLSIRTTQGPVVLVDSALAPLENEHAQIALHYLPAGGLKPGAWGMGSCEWYPRACPVGHHQNPGYFFSFVGHGVLRRDPWRLDLFAGGSTEIQFEKMLGHHGRMAAATVMSVEAMREKADLGAVTGVGAESLKDLFRQLGSKGKL